MIINRYKDITKYLFSMSICFLLDQILFYVFRIALINNMGDTSIFVGALFSRLISFFLFYILNKSKLFGTNNKANLLYKYYAVVIIQLGISTILLFIIYKLTNIDISIIKVIIDLCLFIMIYLFQKRMIKNKE